MTFDPSDPMPGVYTGVPIEQYQQGPGVSRSSLKMIGESPAAWRHAQDNPRKTTRAMDFGTALHYAVLEPEEFEARVVDTEANPMPKKDFTLKSFGTREEYDAAMDDLERAKAEWEVNARGKVALSTEQYRRCLQARDFVKTKKGPKVALQEGTVETSIYWEDHASGELVKARPDFVRPEFIVDLKTIRSLDDATVQRSIEDYAYHVQGAMCRWGLMQATGAIDALPFYLLLVQAAPAQNLDMRLVRVDELWLSRGERLFQKWLKTYAECKASGDWPGYADRGVTECAMPGWLVKREEEEDDQDAKRNRGAA